MAYGTPSDPTAGTVITVAYAVANLLDPIRWLRILTGGADPPGSSYVVVSDSPTGSTWRKVPTDAIAAGADDAVLTVVGSAVTWRDQSLLSVGDSLLLDGHAPGNAVNDIPINNGVSNPNLVAGTAGNASLLAGQPPGNAAGQIAINNGVECVGLIAQLATNATNATSATTATTATNASQLGGVAAAGYPTLAGGGNFTTRPTYGSDALAVVASGTYGGANSSSRQITTGFVPKYVRLVGVNASTTVVMQDIISATPANNVQIAGTLSSQVITNVGTTALHASDGFVVSAVDLTDASGYTYSWVAFG